MRGGPVLLVALGVLAGCGSSSTPAPAPAPPGPSQQELDLRDTRAIQRQVDRQVSDRLQTSAAEQNDYVDSDTTCTKQSDTAYKCLTTFVSPAGTPEAVTDVTCDRSGGSCITETRP